MQRQSAAPANVMEQTSFYAPCRLEIPAAVWRAACGGVSTEASRPALRGVYVQRAAGQLTVTAADGHQLAQYTSSSAGDGGDVAVIVPPVKLSALAVPASKVACSVVVLSGAGYTWNVSALAPYPTNRVVNVTACGDGPYPPVSSSLPTHVGFAATRFALDPAVLEKLVGTWGCPVAFDFGTRGILVTPRQPIAEGWETTALIMPVRSDLFPSCNLPSVGAGAWPPTSP